ncbi:8-amino-7-oxononanoate synthase [Aureitalea sp. L0-47]|uniref:aminotransferase class I/II-fold pyridoxal phosphate-dependent enzyme n=1 Tax=Aureitalea sp. L0-47 TaxID=2816962 RepID=UPI002237EE5D|nr:8-amino-7-oxononanoate synthase [Aureitalea sp. L0-47]MCW5518379.1 8-amino-7-oxononanoate synthase [Aureitalea sp. L0-47]
MAEFPKKLLQKLQQRKEDNALRHLSVPGKGVDFSSNDYLGFSRNPDIAKRANEIFSSYTEETSGATGSRLLTGNSTLYNETEQYIAEFHFSPAALIFNSGYAANIGLLGSVPQRGDYILYDELVHASIREGISLSNAKAFKFPHNNLESLENQIDRLERSPDCEVYVVTESVFSMDGDTPDLKRISSLCKRLNCRLIVDEAHAIGISQRGLVVDTGIENDVFARVVTFGKALGCHGAAVLCSEILNSYLVNFARSFIYTTGLPPHTLATVKSAYEYLDSDSGIEEIEILKSNIAILRRYAYKYGLREMFLPSASAIHSIVIPGNDEVKSFSEKLMEMGFDIRPILSPTVPKGKERLRICLHSFNTEKEIEQVMQRIAIFTS